MFYFCGSIRGGLSDTKIYHELIKTIKEFGECLTEHVGNLEYLDNETKTDQEIWIRDMEMLKSSKLVIAEVTVPSIGVGYELGIAESLKIPTLVLYRNNSRKCSAMITGNDFFTLKYYETVEEANDYIKEFILSRADEELTENSLDENIIIEEPVAFVVEEPEDELVDELEEFLEPVEDVQEIQEDSEEVLMVDEEPDNDTQDTNDAEMEGDAAPAGDSHAQNPQALSAQEAQTLYIQEAQAIGAQEAQNHESQDAENHESQEEMYESGDDESQEAQSIDESLFYELQELKSSTEFIKVLRFLGIQELKSLKEFVDKLQGFIFSQDEDSILNLKSQLETLKAKNRVLEVDLEDKGNVLERQSYEFNTEITKLRKECKEMSDKNNDLSQVVAAEVAKNKQKDLELRSTRETMNSQVDIISKLEVEKRELFSLNVKKQEELEALKENLENCSNQVNSLRQELSMASHELTDVQSSDAKMRSELSMCEQQIGQLKRNNEWLNQELQKTTHEFNDYRRSKGEQISQLQSLFESCSQERSSLEIKSVSLEKKNTELEEKVQSLLEKTEELMNLGEKQFRSEMLSQKKLTELYEDKLAMNEERVAELHNLIKELEGKVDSFANERSQILAQHDENIKHLQDEISQKNSEITKLKGELENINETFPPNEQADYQGIGLLSPSAAAVSRLEKSGKTFTQIYYDYTTLQEQFAKEKRESARAKQMLESIMSELAERAPVYESFRVDLENLRLENEGMQKDLADAQRQRDELLQKYSDLRIKVSKLEHENRIISQGAFIRKLIAENRDLGRQVQGLLRQMENVGSDFAGLRCLESSSLQRIVDRNDEGVSLDVLESDSDALISEKLVVFRNIEELQNQNQILRRTVRNLSQKMEEIEIEQSRQRDEQISKEMEEASKTIESLQEQLRIQCLKLDTFTRERDQWKKIAEGRLSSNSPPKERGSRAPSPGSELSRNAEAEIMNRDVQIEFDIYRKESDTNIKMLKDSIDSLNQEKLELSIQVARLSSQNSFQQERYALLVSNTDGQAKELTILREKLTTAASTLSRQESKIQELTVSLSESLQTLEIIKNENQQMKIDREVWKATEARTSKERQDLVRERNSAIDRLREVQHQFDDKDRLATAERKRIEVQLESLQKEMQSTRKQLNDLMDEHRSMSARHDIESKESQSRIENLSTALEKTKGELCLAQNKELNLNERLHESNARLKSAEEKLLIYEGRARLISHSSDSSPEDRVKSLEIKLNQAKYEISTLSEELKMEKAHSAAFKDISQASEERLSELNSTYDLYKAETEKELEQVKSLVSSLEAEREEIKSRLNSTIQELTSAQERFDAQQIDNSQKVKDLENKLASAQANESSALSQFETLRADMQLHAKIARDAQENYEREVMAHSSSLQSLTAMKEELITLRNQLVEAEQKMFVSERSWNSSKASWELSKTEYENQIQELKTRCNDLSVQNTLLHSQFEQIQSAQRKVSDKIISDMGDGSSFDKSQEELREVIRFLRREKDILQTKLELSLQEGERTSVQLDHLQKSLDEVRATLDEERSRKSDHLVAERKHKELLEKIEHANLLRESNITLRDQLEAALNKQGELEKQLSSAKGEVVPLKENLMSLQAELDVRNDEIEALKNDNNRWKSRTQQILEKYERIDPVEHSRLQGENNSLTLKINEFQSKADEMARRIKELEEVARDMENQLLTCKNSLSEKATEILEKEGLIKKLTEDIELLRNGSKAEELSRAAQEIEKLKADRQNLVQRSNENMTKARQKNLDLLNKNKELEKQIIDLQNKIKSFPTASEAAEKQQKEINELTEKIRAELDQTWSLKVLAAQKQTEGYKKMALELESKQLNLTEELLNLRKKYQALYLSTSSKKVEASADDIEPSVSGKRPRDSKLAFNEDQESTTNIEVNLLEQPSTKRLRIEAEPFVPIIQPSELSDASVDPEGMDNDQVKEDPTEITGRDVDAGMDEDGVFDEENDNDGDQYDDGSENNAFVEEILYAENVTDEDIEALKGLLPYTDEEQDENNVEGEFPADEMTNDEDYLGMEEDSRLEENSKEKEINLKADKGTVGKQENVNLDVEDMKTDIRPVEDAISANFADESAPVDTSEDAAPVQAAKDEVLIDAAAIEPMKETSLKDEPPKRSISPIRVPTGAPAVITKPISPILPPATIMISPIVPPSGSKVIIQRDAIAEPNTSTTSKLEVQTDLLRQKLLQQRTAKSLAASGEKKPRITRNNSGAIIANINRLVASPPAATGASTVATVSENTRGARGGRKAGRGGQRGRGQRGAH